MNGKAGEVIKLQRPSDYWVRRAARHRRQGNRERAAALLRHAVTLSPGDGELRMEYAKTLQEMECYEASTRAAFGALLINPKRYACYGLIGRNMLALGHEQEALDAFSRYLLAVKRAGGIPEFDEELDALEDQETSRPHMRARHEVLLGIAGRRLAAGNAPGAAKALARATPAGRIDDRYQALRSLLCQANGDGAGAVRAARRACKAAPYSARAHCTLAGALSQAGLRAKAAAALLSAALRCENAQDDLLYCYTAASLGLATLALCALRRSLAKSPDRLPTLLNIAVALLKLGRMDDAESLIHRCRALDPTDVPARCAGRTVDQWRELSLTPAQVGLAARALPFYPLLSPAQNNDCLAQLGRALGEGVEAFCQRLQADPVLYDLFLYELGDAQGKLARLIPTLVAHLPRPFAEQLLREALVRQTPDDSVKRYAAAALITLGAKPPFVVWHAGRIAEIDPFVQARPDATMSRMMLMRRMVDIQRHSGDYRLMTHALRILRKMGTQRRGYVARDADKVFRAALEQHYLLTFGLPDNRRLHTLLRYTADERHRVRVAFRHLCKLAPIPKRTPRH